MFPSELKLVHYFPMLFTLGVLAIPIIFFIDKILFFMAVFLLLLYMMMIVIDSAVHNNSLKIGFLSVIACFIQLMGYGFGFMQEKFLGDKK